MKKVIAAITIILLSTSSVSCSRANKKITPQINPPVVQNNGGNDTDSPSQDASKNQAEEVPKENKDTGNNKNTQDSGQTINPGDIPPNLSNEKIASWQPGTNKEHKTPVLNTKYKTLLNKYDGYFTGDASSKVIYLTFDEGYEYGFTGNILDTLKKCNVKAAFFVTKPYIKSSPELVKRMVREGHIVGNHSNNHPSMPDVSNDKVVNELTSTADYFKEVTGTEMPGFFRPPMGEWSERTLYITKSLGYKTILWSMAYKDWEVNNQPGRDAAYKFTDTYYHNGAILLLHAVSKSNTEALEDIIKNLQSKGYRFAPLTELRQQ
jgi:delta-lactam-biosynthetic de-N-acetylase